MIPELEQFERTLDSILSPDYMALRIEERQPLIMAFEDGLSAAVRWGVHPDDKARLVRKLIAATSLVTDLWPVLVLHFVTENGTHDTIPNFLTENPDWQYLITCSCGLPHIVWREQARRIEHLHGPIEFESILHYNRLIVEADAGLQGAFPE